MALDLTPYATARPYLPPRVTWMSAEDAERIASYQLYEAIYRNVPEAFRVIQRGSEQNPIYVPAGKTIIEACDRFLARRWDFVLDPRLGTDADRAALGGLLRDTFIREQMYSKFATQKKFGLIRGDALWHITADPNKPLGKRVSIHELDPASYFPIHDAVEDTKVVGCHLVDQFDKGGGRGVVIRRQTYRKDPLTSRISYEVTWWEETGWDDREGSEQKLKPAPPPPNFTGISAFELPEQITAIPVYHILNERTPGSPFGSSELTGLERIIGGISQAISDEELALAMEGLGVYATDSSGPVDDDDNETDWAMGPGYVVEHDKDSKFVRINGVSSVQPVQDHVSFLERSLREASGTPEIAIGKVDSGVAESGISLSLQMAPMLAKNEGKEQIILSKMDHLLYDLTTMWFPAFEELLSPARAASMVDDPLPVNRKTTLEEILAMLRDGVVSIAYAQGYISEKLGYDFPDKMLEDIVLEQGKLAEARNRDPFTARVAAELDAAQ